MGDVPDVAVPVQLALKFDDPETPFGDYSGMAECIAANDGQPDPQSWCAWAYHDATGRWPELSHDGVMVAFAVDDETALALAQPYGLPPADLHVTLAFLGKSADFDATQVQALHDAVAGFAAAQIPLEGEVSGVGRFTANDPNAVYASVDLPRLPEFRQALVDALERAGLTVARDHGYTPHLTLAYVNPADPAIPVVEPRPLRMEWLLVAVGGHRTIYELGAGLDEEDTVEKHTTKAGDGSVEPAQKQVTVGSVDWVRDQIRAQFRAKHITTDDEDAGCYVTELFFDRAVLEVWSAGATRYFEVSWVQSGDAVAIGQPVEVRHAFVPVGTATPAPTLPAPTAPVPTLSPVTYRLSDTAALTSGKALEIVVGEDGVARVDGVELEVVEKAGSPELTGPIVRKDAKRQIAYAPVLVPGEPDSDGDVLSAEKIEDVAHVWLADYRNIDLQHSLNNVPVVPVESYISPTDQVVKIDGAEVVLPAGSWIMGAQFRDDQLWGAVERGELTGFSIMGVPESALKEAVAAVKHGGLEAAALKRTTLTDIGGGDPNGPWVAPFVSVVDRPAVPKAKFFAFKAVEPAPDETAGQSVWKRFKNWLLAVPADGGATSYGDGHEPITAIKEMQVSDQSDDKGQAATEAEEFQTAVKSAVSEAVMEAIRPTVEQVAGLADALKTLTEEVAVLKSDGAGGETKGADDEGDAGAAATKSEVDTESEAFQAAVDAAVKEQLEPVLAKLDQVEGRIPKAASKSLTGQDGIAGEDAGAATVTSEDPYPRDAFGRRINR